MREGYNTPSGRVLSPLAAKEGFDTESLTVVNRNLPATLPELAQFALIGREKLASVRAEIRAIKKVGLAKEVLEQKRAEAQEIAELVTLSEMQIGSMLREIPKADNGGANQYKAKSTPMSNEQKPKSVVLEEIGIPQKTAERFQKMAEHEDVVREAIAEAREQDEIITRSAVLKKIDEATHKPHVANNSGNNEWYTPAEYIEAAREAMGSIDLDPASNKVANEVVKASTYYTAETNGLDKTWTGNIWLNPPYSSDMIDSFINKLVAERGNYEQAVVLVNNATETGWFSKLISIASAVCFPRGRIRFYMPNGKSGAPLQGQAIIYIGSRPEQFTDAFANIGWRCGTDGIYQ